MIMKAGTDILTMRGSYGFDVHVPKMELEQEYTFSFIDSTYVIKRDKNDALHMREVE